MLGWPIEVAEQEVDVLLADLQWPAKTIPQVVEYGAGLHK